MRTVNESWIRAQPVDPATDKWLGELRLAAAAPFYGTTPDEGPNFSKSKAAVLGVYAELDDRDNATRDGAEAALEKAKLKHEVVTYPGEAHAKVLSGFGEYLA